MPKTRGEIEALKANWFNDAYWDIETTEGFEDHKDELLAYRQEMEAIWESELKSKKLCPILAMSPAGSKLIYCERDACAWWDEVAEQCAIRRLTELTRK